MDTATPLDPKGTACITSYPDGPYLLSGDFQLFDEHGDSIDVRRKIVALCRCGRSRRKPFCDGTHKLVKFRAAGGVVKSGSTLPTSAGSDSESRDE